MQTESVERRGEAPLRRAGKGSHRRVGDVHVLSLAGSDHEMGRQHGELLADEIRRGPIPYYRRIVEKLMGTLDVDGDGQLSKEEFMSLLY